MTVASPVQVTAALLAKNLIIGTREIHGRRSLSKGGLPAKALPALIGSMLIAAEEMHRPISGEEMPDEPAVSNLPARRAQQPAVPVSKSIQHDHLVCLEDGQEFGMLKRHLRTGHGLTPEEYRRKWRLPPEYPMVAPSESARRSEVAKEIGLGLAVGHRRRRRQTRHSKR